MNATPRRPLQPPDRRLALARLGARSALTATLLSLAFAAPAQAQPRATIFLPHAVRDATAYDTLALSHVGGASYDAVVHGDALYRADGTDVVVISLADPAQPVAVRRVTGADVVYDLTLVGDRLWVHTAEESRLFALDDPWAPRLLWDTAAHPEWPIESRRLPLPDATSKVVVPGDGRQVLVVTSEVIALLELADDGPLVRDRHAIGSPFELGQVTVAASAARVVYANRWPEDYYGDTELAYLPLLDGSFGPVHRVATPGVQAITALLIRGRFVFALEQTSSPAFGWQLGITYLADEPQRVGAIPVPYSIAFYDEPGGRIRIHAADGRLVWLDARAPSQSTIAAEVRACAGSKPVYVASAAGRVFVRCGAVEGDELVEVALDGPSGPQVVGRLMIGQTPTMAPARPIVAPGAAAATSQARDVAPEGNMAASGAVALASWYGATRVVDARRSGTLVETGSWHSSEPVLAAEDALGRLWAVEDPGPFDCGGYDLPFPGRSQQRMAPYSVEPVDGMRPLAAAIPTRDCVDRVVAAADGVATVQWDVSRRARAASYGLSIAGQPSFGLSGIVGSFDGRREDADIVADATGLWLLVGHHVLRAHLAGGGPPMPIIRPGPADGAAPGRRLAIIGQRAYTMAGTVDDRRLVAHDISNPYTRTLRVAEWRMGGGDVIGHGPWLLQFGGDALLRVLLPQAVKPPIEVAQLARPVGEGGCADTGRHIEAVVSVGRLFVLECASGAAEGVVRPPGGVLYAIDLTAPNRPRLVATTRVPFFGPLSPSADGVWIAAGVAGMYRASVREVVASGER